jgi:hypothetical protein
MTQTTTPGYTDTVIAKKFAASQAVGQKETSLMQSMPVTLIGFGLFSVLLGSAAVGFMVRAARSYRHSTRLMFTPHPSNSEAGDINAAYSDLESNQALLSSE